MTESSNKIVSADPSVWKLFFVSVYRVVFIASSKVFQPSEQGRYLCLSFLVFRARELYLKEQ